MTIDLYGEFEEIDLRFFDHPVRVQLAFRLGDSKHHFEFLRAGSLAPFLSIFSDCWGMKIIDCNREESGNCLEYGRFRVEFWDEDALIDQVRVDEYNHSKV